MSCEAALSVLAALVVTERGRAFESEVTPNRGGVFTLAKTSELLWPLWWCLERGGGTSEEFLVPKVAVIAAAALPLLLPLSA
eukprot:CAMPEP_0171871016 /NCGR_PEP_ID=MMETSP0992-20121227/32969_1 /TAXON_ID=483369 /ORGANISM="non described non described, Strain CCMP2098" /LENGTH=81 /DNA_ID=CAMNT_0012495233 /DNA_START=36 /DNA_END=278 /DNA_ORIENTATION=+